MDTSLAELDTIIEATVRRRLDDKGLTNVSVSLEDFGEADPAIRVDLHYNRDYFSAPELMSDLTAEIRETLLRKGDERPVLLRGRFTDDIFDDDEE